MNMKNKSVNFVKRYLPVIIFFVVTVLLVGPLSLYYSNSEDLWFTLNEVVKVVIPVSLSAFIILCLVFFFLPEHISNFLTKLLFGITLGFYVQGLININYGTGVLDGGEIRWNEYVKYGILDTFVWILCLLIPFILPLIFKKKEKIPGIIMTVVSIYITLIQIPGVIVQAANYRPNNNSELAITDKGIFDLSEKENVVIFVIDTLDEAYYRDFIEENPDFVNSLTGFVHYDNTLASGARTVIGLPSMFTGVPFDRSIPYSEYKDKIWSGENPLKILNKNGYDIGFYSEKKHFSDASIPYISNFTDNGMKIGSLRIFGEKLYKLEMLQIFPHFLKRFVWMYTSEFDEAMDTINADSYVIDDAKFIKGYKNSSFSYGSVDKAVRIYHLDGAHSPYTLSRDGTRVKNSTLEDQVYGCFACVNLMLDDMKEHGVYDTATIIITADHGEKNNAQQPVFLVKRSGSVEPYQTNHSPVSLFDLPIFLAGLVNKQVKNQHYGVDFLSLDEGEIRERRFYKNNSTKGIVEEYVTEGMAGDTESLILIKNHQDKMGKDTPYTLGDTLLFDMEATGNIYITEGTLRNTGFRTALRSKHTRMEVPIKKLPSKRSLDIEIKLHKSFTLEDVACRFTANGQTVFEGSTTDIKNNNSVISFDVPVDSFDKSKILILDFDFPNVAENDVSSDGIISLISMVIVEKE